ncbi:hypothetical protein RD792_014752 [Penstemon davidsonii]|uniref:Uncharacterized protein n=1 Tax=Penstemon davidsonii TaxID=160366 RepID=A0ABR0CS02_9LAMI|nr:hypothetical protein RD792_014752 [Penstemon davidsonii]
MASMTSPSIAAAVSPPYFRNGVLRRNQQFTSTSSSPCNDLFRMNNSMTKVVRFSSRVRRACLFNPNQQPILKQALKEPSAFLGGMFAGLLRIDLNEDPLKEWVARTVEASGITEEQISNTTDARGEEDVPVEIDIE